MSGLIANPDLMTQAIMRSAATHQGQTFNSAAAANMRQSQAGTGVFNSVPPSGLLANPQQAIKQANPLNTKIATTTTPITPVTTTPAPTTPAPTTTTPPTVTNTLNPDTTTNNFPYYGYYYGNDSIDQDPTTDPRAQSFLSAYQKYDPNAHFSSNGVYGGEGGPESWSFVGDHTKLPGGGPTGMDQNPGDFNPMRTTSGEILSGNAAANDNGGGATATNRGVSTVLKPGQVTTLANANRANLVNQNLLYGNNQYGYETPSSNVKTDHSIWDVLGPALPLLFGTIMSGGALSPALSAALHTPQALDSISNGANPLTTLASLGIGAIPGVSPTMANLGRYAINSTQRGG